LTDRFRLIFTKWHNPAITLTCGFLIERTQVQFVLLSNKGELLNRSNVLSFFAIRT
jgi:hypothetical protein